MGQKINPISLRLPINRSVDSLWFSDAYDTKLMVQYIHLQKYIESLFQLAPNLTLGRFFVDVFPKKWILSCFVHEKRNLNIKLSLEKKKRLDSFSKRPGTSENHNNIHDSALTELYAAAILRLFYQQLYTQTIHSRIYQPRQVFLQQLISFLAYTNKKYLLSTYALTQGRSLGPTLSQRKNLNEKSKNFSVSDSIFQNNLTRKWLYRKDSLLQQVESSINKNVNCSTQVFVLKSQNSLSSANFFVKEIASQLEKKMSINQIWNQIIKRVIQTSFIQGIRLSVSGRINGVEMARTEIRKYGQTSLHSLSNKMDYASCYAYTPFGILGVKIWICYR